MRYILAFSIAILQLAHVAHASQDSIINCTWPCYDDSAKCVVTPDGASCQIITGDSWILNSPKKSPSFTGASVSTVLAPCIPAPNPQLPIATPNATTNSNQTIISWPSWTLRRPLDQYLGNCGNDLYCSSVGEDASRPVCRQRQSVGSPCVSSNQCHAGFCSQNICHPKSENVGTDGHTHDTSNSSRNNGHMSNKTVQILASVFGIVGALLFVGIGLFMYRRHRHRVNNNNKQQDEFYQAPNNNLSSSSNSFNVNITPLNGGYKEQQFASDFLSDHSQNTASPSPVSATTPAMRQSQLQAELLNNYNSDENGLLKPPPSYRP